MRKTSPFSRLHIGVILLICISASSCYQNIEIGYLGAGLLFITLIIGIYQFQKKKFILRSKSIYESQEAKQLKEMDEFKTRLYTNITHEFRTPLTVILGLSEQISDNLETLPTETTKEHLGLISSNGKNLLLLVNQILDLSKLESSSMVVNLVQTDIISQLQNIIESFSPFANTKKITLKFQTELENLQMDFDKDMMLKIISNLVSNAIKYTNEGGKVHLLAELQDEQTLILKVIDTGTGIPKEQVPHIFERFFQATTESLQKQIGTGIGLSLTRELVSLLEGEISVESQLGIGTTFTIQLPIRNNAIVESSNNLNTSLLNEIDAYTVWAKDHQQKKSTVEEVDEDIPTLLIIEDNKDIVTYLKTILSPIYQLLTAPNGKVGVELATEHVPDIILSDVMMPEMDGFEVCNFLKNDERTSHIPIVLLTARSEIQSKLHGFERGADAYISKPFNKNELLIRLKKLIELRKTLQTRYANFSPEQPSEDVALKIEDAFLQKLRLEVEKKIDDPQFGIMELCRAVNLSRMQVHRKIKALSGKTTSIFIRSIRLQKSKQLLLTTDMNISEVAFEVGYSDPSYFSRTFTSEFGMPPTEFLSQQNKAAS